MFFLNCSSPIVFQIGYDFHKPNNLVGVGLKGGTALYGQRGFPLSNSLSNSIFQRFLEPKLIYNFLFGNFDKELMLCINFLNFPFHKLFKLPADFVIFCV